MYEYSIEGGHPISGTVKASGNKNAALPCIAAALLTKETVTLRNIPDIEDTRVMLEILKALGVTVENCGDHVWNITAAQVNRSDIPSEYTKKYALPFFLQGRLLPAWEKQPCFLPAEMSSAAAAWTHTFLP